MCTLNHWTPALVAATRDFGGTVLLHPGSVCDPPAAVHCARYSIRRVLLSVGGRTYCLRAGSLGCCAPVGPVSVCAMCQSTAA